MDVWEGGHHSYSKGDTQETDRFFSLEPTQDVWFGETELRDAGVEEGPEAMGVGELAWGRFWPWGKGREQGFPGWRNEQKTTEK